LNAFLRMRHSLVN